jgi:NADPH:quinone reductase-like Zn-dependent oxidoreductase
VIAPGGLAISIVGPADPAFARELGKPLLAPVMAALSGRTCWLARTRGVRHAFLFMRAVGPRLAELAALHDTGTLRPTLDRTFPFDKTPAALEYVEQGRAKGKIVVTQPPAEASLFPHSAEA